MKQAEMPWTEWRPREVEWDGMHVVSFSGGRTSAFLCRVMLDTFPRDRIRFVFMDTGAEHPKTYEFIRRVDKWLGLDLVCLRGRFNQPLGEGHTVDVVPVEKLSADLGVYSEMIAKYGPPGQRAPWCTSRMKEETHDRYCNRAFGRGKYATWLGIRADEPRRLRRVGASPLLRFMAEISPADKEDVVDFWKAAPFDLGIPEWLGNCVFCFKKSELKLAAAARDEPEMLREWLGMLEAARARGHGVEGRQMYRGRRTLLQVVGAFDSSPTAAIKARIRGNHSLDAGSCSESCEIFPESEPRGAASS
jgi:hypothetical protein